MRFAGCMLSASFFPLAFLYLLMRHSFGEKSLGIVVVVILFYFFCCVLCEVVKKLLNLTFQRTLPKILD